MRICCIKELQGAHMEFHSELTQPLPDGKARGYWNGPLPFYMAYPGYLSPRQEAMVLKDLEYLQQLYPGDVKRYNRRVAEILDKTDYEGSMIYDEYPDRYSLQYLARTICGILEKEEENPPGEDLIQVLLFNEIYKRRHGGQRAVTFF